MHSSFKQYVFLLLIIVCGAPFTGTPNIITALSHNICYICLHTLYTKCNNCYHTDIIKYLTILDLCACKKRKKKIVSKG